MQVVNGKGGSKGWGGWPLALVVIGLLALPVVLGSPYYLTIAIQIGIYGIAAIGLSLLMGSAGQVSLSQAAFFGVGAYVSALLSVHLGINPWLTMIIGAAVASGVAVLVGLPLLRFEGHVLAVATLALAIIVYTLITQLRSLTGGFDGISGIPHFSIFGFVFKSDISNYYLVWSITIVIFALSHNIIHSRFGRALRSIHHFAGGDEIAAQSVSVTPWKYKLQVFILSAFYTGIAGGLYAHWIGYISPEPFGVLVNIMFVIMVTIGGMGSLWGALIGATIVILSGEVFREVVPLVLRGEGATGEIQIIAYGAMLIVILLVLPGGLVSAPRAISHWRRRVPRQVQELPPEMLEGSDD